MSKQEPPLVGREAELEFLDRALQQASHGTGSLVFIVGEAGIGKSRLADEFSKSAVERRDLVLVSRCLPGPPTPYLPFLDILRQYYEVKSPTSAKVNAGHLGMKAWLRGPGTTIREEHPGLEPHSHSERTMYDTLESFREMSSHKPILIILDDLQWADSASIQLLHFLARNLAELKILLVGTYRPEDLATKSGKPHALLESLRMMRREGICQEMSLDRLNLDELGRAIEGMLGGQVDPELLRAIESETGGNPLFAVETVRLLFQTKSITLRDGKWRSSGGLRIDVPSTIREVILRRIDRLPREERRILEFAAAIGFDFEPAFLSEVVHLDMLELLETLDHLERDTQLLRANQKLYRFSHEKIRQIVYEQVSPLRQKELHRLAGEVMEARSRDENLYGPLAFHFCQAGVVDKCVRYSLEAGTSSMKKFSVMEAIHYLQSVIEHTHDDSSFLEERLKALEGLGDAEATLGLYDSALSSYDAFLTLCTEKTEKARVLRKSAECDFPWMSSQKLDSSKAVRLLDLAESYGNIETAESGRIRRLRGKIAYRTSAFDQAGHFYKEAEKSFLAAGETEDLSRTLLDYADLHLSEGRVEEALNKARRSMELFSALQSPGGELDASFELGMIYFHLGLTEESLAYFVRAIEIAGKLGRHASLVWAHVYAQDVYFSISNFEAARREAMKAREHALKTESVFLQTLANAVLGHCDIPLGNLREAGKLLQEASETLEKLSGDFPVLVHPMVTIDQAQLLAAESDWTASNAKFRQGVELFRGMRYGILYEAMARKRFGDTLLQQGNSTDAQGQFAIALGLYEKLGNRKQAESLKQLVAEFPTTG